MYRNFSANSLTQYVGRLSFGFAKIAPLPRRRITVDIDGFATPYNRGESSELSGYWCDVRYDFGATQEVGTDHAEIRHMWGGTSFCAERAG